MRDVDFLKQAFKVAKRSCDTSTQVGCVLVTDEGIRLGCHNHFPKNVEYKPERTERPAKYNWTVHAEANLIATASKLGIKTQDCAVYSTQIPCSTCMGILINAGISVVVCPNPDQLQLKWRDDAAISIQMTVESGLHLVYLELPKE